MWWRGSWQAIQPRAIGWVIAGWLLLLNSSCGQQMQVHDERFDVTLFADASQVVTPIGMAIDANDRIYVIESHTHLRPQNYRGPSSDRIKVFVDENDDGRPDQITLFAEGIHAAMNLAFSPAGDLYVVCARQVLKLPDHDGDGSADERIRILELDTPERYAHNSLLGLVFDRDGKLYVSRGNTGSSRYAARGTDGSVVEGYGDGGSVIRCNADGSEVEEYATGFWNPFDLKFRLTGDLLLVDNDPDARGPNRLLKLVAGGDYGYKSLYGGGGNHPFQGWDGRLPGTLPFMAGTGEAPAGLIDLGRTHFPDAYRESILVTIWNENSIERFDLSKGLDAASIDKSIFATGPQDFRPVALACDSRGNLFVSDWVLVDYPNHGQGRIWRISARKGIPRTSAIGEFARPEISEVTGSFDSAVELRLALQGSDPYLAHEARRVLSRSEWSTLRAHWSEHKDGRLRLAAVLAERRAHPQAGLQNLRQFLADDDASIRIAALMWAAESFDPQLRSVIDHGLTGNSVTPRVFEHWWAATKNLHPRVAADYHARRFKKANQIEFRGDPTALSAVARRVNLKPSVRAMAIMHYDAPRVAHDADFLLECLSSSDRELQLAAIDRLSIASDATLRELVTDRLLRIASDSGSDADIRCAALDGLSRSKFVADELGLLLVSADLEVSLAVADLLRANAEQPVSRKLALAALESPARLPIPVQEQLAYALYGADATRNSFAAERPRAAEQWYALADGPGSVARGKRVFMSSHAGCSGCHTIDGRGAVLGPDLSHVAQSKSRKKIVEAIIDPSAEFPPQYQAWLVLTEDGEVHRGIQLDHKAGGAIVLTTESGKNERFAAADIADYRASPTSLMPDGLEESMSVGEFRDLIAFLASLQ